MRPRLVSVHFNRDDEYARLARVLRHTAARHCPGWEISIRAVQPAHLARHPAASKSHVANTQKMECWWEAIAAAPDGARVLLIDCDTAIIRPLDDVWAEDFDFAYTTKDSRFPFNSGVVFVQVNARSRAFVKVWRDENLRMLTEGVHHLEWRKRYGGINQASLGYALSQNLAGDCRLRQLPCREWNCEDSAWDTFDPTVTRILHLKSALRMTVFRGLASPLKVRNLARYWHELEREARAQEVASA